jgi:hypothetical protein
MPIPFPSIDALLPPDDVTEGHFFCIPQGQNTSQRVKVPYVPPKTRPHPLIVMPCNVVSLQTVTHPKYPLTLLTYRSTSTTLQPFSAARTFSPLQLSPFQLARQLTLLAFQELRLERLTPSHCWECQTQ